VNQQLNVITDFAQTFECDTGMIMASCREVVENSDSIFHGFSYLIQHLLPLIDSAMPCETFTIKGLTVSQRRDFYIELSVIDISFTKIRYIDYTRNVNDPIDCTDICIPTTHIWSVPDFRTTPQNCIYQYRINLFHAFYNQTEIRRTISNGDIFVVLGNFIKFRKILVDAVTSYNTQYNHTYTHYSTFNIAPSVSLGAPSVSLGAPSVSLGAPSVSVGAQRIQSIPYVSSNTVIKHHLADLIFDIKYDLSDSMYKEILEKIALISP